MAVGGLGVEGEAVAPDPGAVIGYEGLELPVLLDVVFAAGHLPGSVFRWEDSLPVLVSDLFVYAEVAGNTCSGEKDHLLVEAYHFSLVAKSGFAFDGPREAQFSRVTDTSFVQAVLMDGLSLRTQADGQGATEENQSSDRPERHTAWGPSPLAEELLGAHGIVGYRSAPEDSA